MAKNMATKISHKVQEYCPPPPYLGIIPKKKQNSFLVLPLIVLGGSERFPGWFVHF